MSKRCVSIAFLILGGALVLGALGLTWLNIQDDRSAETYSAEACAAVQDVTEARQGIVAEVQTVPDYVIDPDLPMPVCEIDGWDYIGTLSIPALDKTFAIMDQWSYEGLKISPGRYQGSVYTNDLVICGHNYRSHFGQLQYLVVGDEIQFTDVDGNTFDYTVSAVETLDGTDVDGMVSGDWDLTLYTCTVGGKQRIAIRCILSMTVQNQKEVAAVALPHS